LFSCFPSLRGEGIKGRVRNFPSALHPHLYPLPSYGEEKRIPLPLRGEGQGEGEELFLYSPPPPISSPLVWGGIKSPLTPLYKRGELGGFLPHFVKEGGMDCFSFLSKERLGWGFPFASIF